MRSSVAATLTIVALVGTSAVGLAQKTASDPPALTVESDRVDLGSITAGDDAIGTFVFHNHSDEPVKIIRAKPS